MSTARILLATILGGIVTFGWSAIDHMVLPFGEMGFSTLPDEESVMRQLKQAIPRQGLYMFPGLDMKHATEAEREAWKKKYLAGPHGLLVFNPGGEDPMTPRQLVTEFVSDVLGALILAIVFARLGGSWPLCALMGLLLGIFAWMSIVVSYWNWYEFPWPFAVAELIDQGVGWLLGGAAIGLALGRRHPTVAVAR